MMAYRPNPLDTIGIAFPPKYWYWQSCWLKIPMTSERKPAWRKGEPTILLVAMRRKRIPASFPMKNCLNARKSMTVAPIRNYWPPCMPWATG